MTHFRGIPDATWTELTALCSTRGNPVRGKLTTEAHLVSCNECRRVLKLNPRLDVEDESEKRFP